MNEAGFGKLLILLENLQYGSQCYRQYSLGGKSNMTQQNKLLPNTSEKKQKSENKGIVFPRIVSSLE